MNPLWLIPIALGVFLAFGAYKLVRFMLSDGERESR